MKYVRVYKIKVPLIFKTFIKYLVVLCFFVQWPKSTGSTFKAKNNFLVRIAQ